MILELEEEIGKEVLEGRRERGRGRKGGIAGGREREGGRDRKGRIGGWGGGECLRMVAIHGY